MRIVAKDLTKRYGTGENQVIALHKANLEIQARDFISIVGPSGSGKSTLLHLISGLDYPTEGVWNMMVRISIKERTRSCQHFAGEELGLFFKNFI